MACRLDEACPLDFGLIAEEVAEVFPELVGRDTDEQIVTVHYYKLIPMLLNELQKQQRMIESHRQALEGEQAQRLEQAAQLRTLAEQLTALDPRMAAVQAHGAHGAAAGVQSLIFREWGENEVTK